MSGSNPPGQSVPNIVPVFNDVLPKEGSKMCLVTALWGNTFTYPVPGLITINLLQSYFSGQFTSIQAVYIDNSTCPYQVTVTCLDTEYSVKIPPFSQGVFPLFCGTAPQISCQLNYVTDRNSGLVAFPNCSTRFYFLNTPRSAFLETLPSFGNNFAQLTAQAVFGPGNYGQLVQIIPGAGPLTYYLITNLTITASLGFTNGSPYITEFLLAEMGTAAGGQAPSATSWDRFRAIGSSDAAGDPGQLITLSASFNPPIITINPNNGLGALLTTAPPHAASVVVDLVLGYGTVLIQ